MPSNCPHCSGNLTVTQLREIMLALPAAARRKLGGHLLASTRIRKAQRRGGRPRTDVPHCPCGQYTLATATKRNHKCVEPLNAIHDTGEAV